MNNTVTESLLSQIKKGREGKNWGFDIGLPKLQEVTDGVTQSTYTLIFSQSGTGKTSYALYAYIFRPLMEHLDDNKFKVTYFSLEMSSEMLFAKLLCMYIFEKYHIELSTKELLSRKKGQILDDKLYHIVLECKDWLDKVEKIITVHDKSLSADTLYCILMNELEKTGEFKELETRKIYIPKDPDQVHLVVIDHLSLVMRKNGRSLKEEMDLISSYLVTLRNKCKISPLVIMQANRNSSSMDRRKEAMSNLTINDIKDSGSPANDSEVIVSIFNPYRERLNNYKGYNVRELGQNFRIITVLKNRYGESDIEVGCAFYGKISFFAEMPLPDKIYDYDKYKTTDWLFNKEEEQVIEDKENKELKFNF